MSNPMPMSASDAAQSRILNDDDPMPQAALEQLAVTYSIRTILLWTLVIAPIVLTTVGIVLHTSVDDPGITS
ncbi:MULTISPECIES: hypothetical protein [unclassified Amycolatopsis]|uniref:hypothetical protein n=1 Tax=unclassified Amycolatopsis TaxID=2618356 RepID=UPI002E1B3643|nr:MULTISPECIES: hypothetical protein [unclassified Amycolatopsis]